MDCPSCGELVETGAAFCGNCGQALTPASAPQPTVPDANAGQNPPATAQTAGASATVPTYAIPEPDLQSGQMKATMSLVLGILGIVGALFIAVSGLVLGVVGIVLATLSRRVIKHGLSTAGLIVSVVAIVAGLGSWAYTANHLAQAKQHATQSAERTNSAPIQASASLNTPCYSISFANKLNIENSTGSCDMNAFDGDTFDNSNNAYKVYATTSSVSAVGFPNLAKQAIENDVHKSLPSFTITRETSGQFAGSPAYFVTTTNNQGVSLIEAVALHQTANGENFFVFVHAVGGDTVDLNALQSGWQWD